jgi:hypothetical protein
MVTNMYVFFDKFNFLQSSHTDGYFFFPAHCICKHVPCSTLTHSTNEDLLDIKRKGDTKSWTLSCARKLTVEIS